MVGIDKSSVSATVGLNNAVTTAIVYGPNIEAGRTPVQQGGFQMLGWLISAGFGAFAGGIVGLFYWLLASR